MELIELKRDSSVEAICRLCLTEQEYSQSIFGTDTDSLHSWIESLTTLKIVRHFNAPSSLCSECQTMLKNFDSFRDMCIMNDIVFKEMYLQLDQAEDQGKLSLKTDLQDDRNASEQDIEKVDFPAADFLVDEGKISVEYQIEKRETDPASAENEEQHQETTNQKKTRKKARKAEIRKKLCPICNTKVSALRSHQLTTHKDYKPFQCEYCSTTFNMMCNLKKHIRRHLQLKTFICSYCQKGFTNSAELKVHVRIHTDEKPYKCSECDKSFRTSGGMTRHVQTHHRKIRPHTCEVCQAKFTLAAHLRRHMLRHTLERPHCCSVCNRKYSRLDLLKAHSCRA